MRLLDQIRRLESEVENLKKDRERLEKIDALQVERVEVFRLDRDRMYLEWDRVTQENVRLKEAAAYYQEVADWAGERFVRILETSKEDLLTSVCNDYDAYFNRGVSALFNAVLDRLDDEEDDIDEAIDEALKPWNVVDAE